MRVSVVELDAYYQPRSEPQVRHIRNLPTEDIPAEALTKTGLVGDNDNFTIFVREGRQLLVNVWPKQLGNRLPETVRVFAIQTGPASEPFDWQAYLDRKGVRRAS